MYKTEDVVQSVSEEATLNSRGYKIIRKLGEGSYAIVYLAEYNPVGGSQSDRTHLACKVIDTTKAPREFVRKFLPRELDILVKLNHPHIIHIHSIFQRRSKYYIFMRFAENGDLLDFVMRNGAVVENQARVWFRQMILAVQYIHDMEIVHRDLKCENILISSNYNIKLADFGFAKYIIDERGRRALSETYCGSLSYAAPEILRGIPYNPKISDLWSLGVILYIMLNRAMPFDDRSIRNLYEQQMGRKWRFRTKYESVSSNQVKKLVTMLLEPDVTKRITVQQVLNSEWIRMDSRLLMMSAAERIANSTIREERKRIISGIFRKPEETNRSITRAFAGASQFDDIIFIKMAGKNPNPTPSTNMT